MKVVELDKATNSLAAYASEVANGPLVVTDHGKPVAVLIPVENADLETVSLSLNPKFIEIIERSRAAAREHTISSEEMRRRFAPKARKNRAKK